MKTLVMRLAGQRFVRFLLVGVINTLIGLGSTLLLLNWAGLNYWWATFLGNASGAVVSYILNRTFTFRSKAGLASSFWRFVLVIVVCYFLSYGISLWISRMLVSMLGALGSQSATELWEKNGAALLGAVIYTLSNYAGHKYFTFRVSSKTK
ncbi:GtrA family protein [Paenibacillus sp. y28]|uniref:GtrA family protein n=1 Tax=Paenibacillus sp. y28 TaxID=3129110 RepID=UPI003016CF94